MLEKLAPPFDLVNGFLVTEDDSHIMRYKRSLILKWSCDLGHPDCNDEAARLFNMWYEQNGHEEIVNP